MTRDEAFPPPPPVLESKKSYDVYDVRVPREFRDLLIRNYPALTNHPNAKAYWRILRCLLFPFTSDKHYSYTEEESTHAIVMPFKLVAICWGKHPKTPNWTADESLADFSENVVKLIIKEHIYTKNRARTVQPLWNTEIRDALLLNLKDLDATCVYLISGKEVSVRNKKAHIDEVKLLRKEQALNYSENHCSYSILQFLNQHSLRAYQQCVKRNADAVSKEIDRIYHSKTSNSKERNRAIYANHVLYSIVNHPFIYYKAVTNSPRIYADKATANALPRESRKQLFKGLYEFDLRACQLAIVARIWEIPILAELLENEADIWQILADYIAEPLIKCKSVLKTAIYSIIFGKSKRNAMYEMAYGKTYGSNPQILHRGLGKEKTSSFFAHHIIKSLLQARDVQLAQIKLDGGGWDAFSKHWGYEDKHTKKRSARTILAAIVQSYELKLMLSAIEVIREQKQTYVVSFLHDGLTLDFGDSTKEERHKRQIVNAVSDCAKKMRIPTHLEISRI